MVWHRLLAALAILGVTFNASAVTYTIVETHTAAPKIITVVVSSGLHEQLDDAQITITPAEWTVDGSGVVAVTHSSIPYDENKDLQSTVRHRVYLELASALTESHNYAIVTPYGNTSLVFNEASTYCEAIKVNQVGYDPQATSRYANFGVFLGDGGSKTYSPLPTYDVVRDSDSAVVLSGTAVYKGDDTVFGSPTTHMASGEHVYRLSLNSVPEGGPYHVVVNGCGRSRSFEISRSALALAAKVSFRGLYHQRCGTALSSTYTPYIRNTCHTTVYDTRKSPWGASTFITVDGEPTFAISGGYHDAGDFDRRPFHAIISVLMLAYYEAFPSKFVDNQYGIPESGNGIPDFLDEALWSLKGWETLQIADSGDADYGGVRQGTETFQHPGYGTDSAANDARGYGTWEVGAETTTLAAGFFAQASRLVAPYDSAHATALLAKAQLAWAWTVANTDENAATAENMYATLQLYLATSDSAYKTLFETAVDAIIISQTTVWPQQYSPGNTAAKIQTAHFFSYLITTLPTNGTLVTNLKNKILNYADTSGYMGPMPENDFYPNGVSKFMGFGAATAQGRYADLWCFAYRIQTDAAKKQLYRNAVAQFADFALGLNPLGVSFVTGLGTDQPVSPLQLDSYYTKYGLTDGVSSPNHAGAPIGNVPGILLYGPSTERSPASYEQAISDKMYPIWEEVAELRRWADGWSLIRQNEFTTWETNVWNATMRGFLADPPPGSLQGVTLSGGSVR